MNFNNEDEVLALFSRLLERLHQADGDHHNSSSPFTLIYVAKGAQNVGSIQNQYMEPSHAPQRGRQTAITPKAVTTLLFMSPPAHSM